MTYAERVARYEAEGLTTSDAQAAADADDLAAPSNRITVEQASAIVDALNPGLPDEGDEDDYDLEWQDDYDPE